MSDAHVCMASEELNLNDKKSWLKGCRVKKKGGKKVIVRIIKNRSYYN